MIRSLLIANRGEIACRIISTAKRLGIRCVAVYSDADANALHVLQADAAVHIGESPAASSYLRADAIIAAAVASGVEAIHPGYGFLSEDAEFAEAVQLAGLIFIGPQPSAIRAMGLKDSAKVLMEQAGVPVVPGYHGTDQSPDLLAVEAARIGYPVMIKARAGGGGKGMRRVEQADDFHDALHSAAREAKSAFGDAAVLIEKYIAAPRHIEVQVFGDRFGNVVHLFERDCSLQRRHQKVIEEAPAPGMTDEFRAALTAAAVSAAKAINYEGAGTVEFIADGSRGLCIDGFWFLEMNTRLQVEHPVTEVVTSVDLVELQIRVASGEALPFTQTDIAIKGHAFEARVYAEDVAAGFLPATGVLQQVCFPEATRVDSGVATGDRISPFYDPLIAKIISSGKTRDEALASLSTALGSTHIAGTVTNLDFLQRLTHLDEFSDGDVDTGLIDRHLETLTATQVASTSAKLVASLCLLQVDINAELCGWRLWGDASHLVDLTVNGVSEQYRLVLHRDGTITLQDAAQMPLLERCAVRRESPTRLRITCNGNRQVVQVASWLERAVPCVSVLTEGHATEFRLANPVTTDSKQFGDTDKVLASMTGVVRQVDVETGQTVKTGDRLLVLEAMKMEIGVDSPRDGVIESVYCKVGDAVEGGSVIISLTAASV